MLGKADVVARVCGALLEGDMDRAALLATAEYPFATPATVSSFREPSACCRRSCRASFRRIQIGK
jgi:hypothetical protein